jgi:tetratricopeptide (TPR) repeat protein
MRIWRVAFVQYISANAGVEKAFPALRQTLVTHSTYPSVRILVADALAERGEVSEAELVLTEGIAAQSAEADRRLLIVRLARLLRDSGRAVEAVDLLKRRLEQISELHNRASIFVALSESYQQVVPPDINASFAMYELALLSNPGDAETRFAAAYAYSQYGQNAMALSHYWETLGHESDSLARNNAGVAARALRLPILATVLQRQAANDQNTLAAGNLAFELTSVGFVEEAEEILAKARLTQNPNERVGLASANIITSKSNEEQSRKTMKTNFDIVSHWRQKQARAILANYSWDLDGVYRGSNVTLNIKASQDVIDGTLSIGSEPRRATLSGKLNGTAVDFAWKAERSPEMVWQLPEEGYGLLILQTPTTVIGFRQKGTSRDALDLGGFVDFTLTKSSDF